MPRDPSMIYPSEKSSACAETAFETYRIQVKRLYESGTLLHITVEDVCNHTVGIILSPADARAVAKRLLEVADELDPQEVADAQQ